MRMRLTAALVTGSLAALGACALTPTQPESKGPAVAGKPYVDVGYLQFVMSGDARNRIPVDLSALPPVAEQCHGMTGVPKAGGVNIISKIAGSVVGVVANLIVSGLQK